VGHGKGHAESMTQLYKITQDILELERLMDSGDVDEDSFKQALDASKETFNDKAVNIVRHIKNLEGFAESCAAEKNNLAKKEKQHKDRAAFYKRYLRDSMIATDNRKIDNPFFNISLRKAPEKLIKAENAKPPAQFVKVETVEKVDNRGLLAAMKSGASFDGYSVGRGDDGLTIK